MHRPRGGSIGGITGPGLESVEPVRTALVLSFSLTAAVRARDRVGARPPHGKWTNSLKPRGGGRRIGSGPSELLRNHKASLRSSPSREFLTKIPQPVAVTQAAKDGDGRPKRLGAGSGCDGQRTPCLPTGRKGAPPAPRPGARREERVKRIRDLVLKAPRQEGQKAVPFSLAATLAPVACSATGCIPLLLRLSSVHEVAGSVDSQRWGWSAEDPSRSTQPRNPPGSDRGVRDSGRHGTNRHGCQGSAGHAVASGREGCSDLRPPEQDLQHRAVE